MQPSRKAPVALIIVLAVFTVWWSQRDAANATQPSAAPPTSPHVAPAPPTTPSTTEDQVGIAFRKKQSDVPVETSGLVERTLADDSEGDRHQRFIVRLASGQTVLVAHNIDLAKRVPVRNGSPVTLRGEYVWNESGGVIHWTHRDPQARHADGWIDFNGIRYQ